MTVTFSVATRLEGVVLEGGWVVKARRALPPDRTPANFSVGYEVESASGEKAFLKAIDYYEALSSENASVKVGEVSQSFNAESNLVFHCRDRKLSKIVRPLASGEYREVNADPRDVVSYLIFEWADGGDARDLVNEVDAKDQLRMLRLCRDATIALSQLHSIEVSHQDVKAANLLIFPSLTGPNGKLGDLGRAHQPGRPTPHDDFVFACHESDAAPEQVYRMKNPLPEDQRRRASDLYMLGSLICFLLVNIPYTGYFALNRPKGLAPNNLLGQFEEVLPGLIDIHIAILQKVEIALDRSYADAVLKILNELCHPDPNVRGSQEAASRGQNRLNLQGYASRLDLIYKRALAAQHRFN